MKVAASTVAVAALRRDQGRVLVESSAWNVWSRSRSLGSRHMARRRARPLGRVAAAAAVGITER